MPAATTCSNLEAMRSPSEGDEVTSPFFSCEDDDDVGSISRGNHLTLSDGDEYIELVPPNRYQPVSQGAIASDYNVLHPCHKQRESQGLHDKGLARSSDIQPETEVLKHDFLVAQLRMELKIRPDRLPPIPEESEIKPSLQSPSPSLNAERPLQKPRRKKVERKSHVDEIRKAYGSYLRRMKKLDVLKYQAMQSQGSHQMKESRTSPTSATHWLPAVKSFLGGSLSHCKAADAIDPSKQAIEDLHRDIEFVYVAQLCLSWELLQWQFKKAQDLRAYESPGYYHNYNRVVGEFQHFQVLMHRFVEKEELHGSRIDYYVQSRCVLRNLLQVPVIAEDNKERGSNEGVTIQTLIQVMEESMRVFWEFLRRNKEVVHHKQIATNQWVGDHQLLADVKTLLQQKKRGVKEIVRIRSLVVKKFQTQEEGKNLQLLMAQVVLSLVWKVVTLPSISTDQLMWCSHKLGEIELQEAEVVVESSFWLFPI